MTMKLKLHLDLRSPWASSVGEKRLGNLPHFSAEPRSGEAENEAEKREYSTELSLLVKIRTFFRENPDPDF